MDKKNYIVNLTLTLTYKIILIIIIIKRRSGIIPPTVKDRDYLGFLDPKALKTELRVFTVVAFCAAWSGGGVL